MIRVHVGLSRQTVSSLVTDEAFIEFVHSFNKHFLRIYQVFGTEDAQVARQSVLPLKSLRAWWENRLAIDNQTNQLMLK